MRLVARALLLLLLTAGPGAAQRGDPIARLESARARSPRSVPALRALGIAYYKAQRFREALPVLESARTLDPKDGLSSLYAGLTAEARHAGRTRPTCSSA